MRPCAQAAAPLLRVLLLSTVSNGLSPINKNELAKQLNPFTPDSATFKIENNFQNYKRETNSTTVKYCSTAFQ